jgi:transposase
MVNMDSEKMSSEAAFNRGQASVDWLLYRMATRFLPIDHDTPLLFPPNLRDWVPENHIVNFIMDAVRLLNFDAAHVNTRGTGSAQYPISMMLGLLIYSYATGTFSSRKIQALTYDSVPVRLLCADTHPDHATICKFRTDNEALLKTAFHQVLECAARAKVLKVGNISLAHDGTKILANASKHSAVSHGHAVEQMKLLSTEIEELLAKANQVDSIPLQDGLSVPEEIKRRTDRIANLQIAVTEIEARAKERHKQELAEHEEQLKTRAEKEAATGKKAPGSLPKAPVEGPRAKDQYNFTDPESRIMKAGGGAFEQSYNAQAGVEIESRLIVEQSVTNAPNDKEQLVPALATLDPVIESVETILTDSGFYSEEAIVELESSEQEALQGTKVLAAINRSKHGRSVGELEEREDPPAPPEEACVKEKMIHRLKTKAGKAKYALRKQTIEPVFGIIKSAMGFRQFMLRGKTKVGLEWTLVTLSYNLKRLYHMGARLNAA